MPQYIYKKLVDWSLLHEGFTIPVDKHDVFCRTNSLHLQHGRRRNITLLLNGTPFYATLLNIGFNRKKYPDHSEMVQIRYPKNGELSKQLQAIFTVSYSLLSALKISGKFKPRQKITLPAPDHEHLVVYLTTQPDTFELDCLTHADMAAIKKQVQNISEMDLEQMLQTDNDASISKKLKLVNIRKLDRSIGNALKRLYSNRCQICGHSTGAEYGSQVSHTHHIDYFTKSLNNDSNNILIICPNHHAIVHATNPIFNHNTLTFSYPNGFNEKLALNKHLF